jgi:riboflavin kinase/FMN adenylyltransferase
MKILYDLKEWNENAVVATIGFFDGVHAGHRFLLNEMCRIAKARNMPSAIITFRLHPRMVIHSEHSPGLLNRFEEKMELLSQTDVDYTIVLDFTPSLASFTAGRFIKDVLAEQWCVKTLLIGYDHRFGYQRADGFEQYVKYGQECDMEVINAGSFINEGVAVSSSVIRDFIVNGDVEAAYEQLGYHYKLSGRVIKGRQLGRRIGFPTANIEVDKGKIIPATGSYAVRVKTDERVFKGMLYIGTRPTVTGGENMLNIEVNIFDFNEDVYNKTVEVEFVKFIRADRKFDSLDELIVQLQADKIAVEKVLS